MRCLNLAWQYTEKSLTEITVMVSVFKPTSFVVWLLFSFVFEHFSYLLFVWAKKGIPLVAL